MKFRKRPLIVEAEQWFPSKNVEGVIYKKRLAGTIYETTTPGVQTIEGFMEVHPGDWIVTGVKGEKYPVKESIFTATFDPVEQDSPCRVPGCGCLQVRPKDREPLVCLCGHATYLKHEKTC